MWLQPARQQTFFFFFLFFCLLTASDSSNPTNNHSHKFNVNYSMCHKTLISSSTVRCQMCAGGHCCIWGFKVLCFLSGLAQQVAHRRHYMVSMTSLHQSSFIWSFDSPPCKECFKLRLHLDNSAVRPNSVPLPVTNMCSALWFPESQSRRQNHGTGQ